MSCSKSSDITYTGTSSSCLILLMTDLDSLIIGLISLSLLPFIPRSLPFVKDVPIYK